MSNKKFIFIDESGDTGTGKDSSEYFIIGALAVNDKGIKTLRRVFAECR